MITDYQETIRNEVSMYHWYGMDGPWNRNDGNEMRDYQIVWNNE